MAGYDDDLRFAHVLADSADDITTRRFRALDLRVEAKPDLTPVTDADRETNRWLGPLFVAMIFAFASIAVANTLAMIGLRRGRELAVGTQQGDVLLWSLADPSRPPRRVGRRGRARRRAGGTPRGA